VDAVLPLIDELRREGAVVVLKIDGERGPGDGGQYTVLVSLGSLKGGGVRADDHTPEDAMARAISLYAAECWGIPLPT